MLLRYSHKDIEAGKSEKFDTNLPHHAYFDEDNVLHICVDIPDEYNFEEGFYAYIMTQDLYNQKFRHSTYEISECSGAVVNKSTREKVEYGISNTVLIDSDYVHDVLFGCYFLETNLKTERMLEITVKINCFDCSRLDADQVAMYSKTQSPVFMSAPFPKISNFHSLYRSTSGANGYDVVLMNIQQEYIHPKGNLIIDLSDTCDTRASGIFILRSRFTRMGLSLFYGTPKGLFHITNNSSWPVRIIKRMFQYVPLRTFNGSVCNTSNILHNASSNKTIEENMDEYETQYKFGNIVTNETAVRKSKC